MPEWILGVGASHNGGACLLRDGELVVATQEERLTRAKRARLRPAFDTLAIAYCLEHAGIGVEDLALAGIARDEPIALPGSDLMRNPLFAAARSAPPIVYVGHHRAHGAAAAYQSGLDEAAVLVIDGLGSPVEDCAPDERAVAGREGWETLSMYHLRDGRLETLRKDVAVDRAWMSIGAHGMPRFAGFGGMYSAVARQLFGQYLEAGKVMGLAPYGAATIEPSRFFTLGEDGPAFSDEVPAMFPGDERWPENEAAYRDLAASVQAAIEVAVLWAARTLRERTGSARLVYAGGVALNCLANERVIRELGYDDVFVMPAAEDSGTSIGAAVSAALAHGRPLARRRLRRDAPGRPYGRAAAERAVARLPLRAGADGAEAGPGEIAERLAAGDFVGWFSGGAELGPRALGQRTLLADPRRADNWAELNRRKGREGFRPLAPIVLAEHAEEWFEMGGRPSSPFMLRVCAVREDARERIPAVVHVDGTARVQTLEREDNPPLHAVLSAFAERTGVPVLVNTSFNAAGEPIVETPEDALWCALRLRLHAVVLDGLLVPLDGGLADDAVARAEPCAPRRALGHPEPHAEELDVETPWGTTRHWVSGDELAVLRELRAAGDAGAALAELEARGLGRAVEGLRRKRLLRVSSASARP